MKEIIFVLGLGLLVGLAIYLFVLVLFIADPALALLNIRLASDVKQIVLGFGQFKWWAILGSLALGEIVTFVAYIGALAEL